MNKITILPGASANLAEASYAIHDETHTLGNALRWMIMKNPKVEFCGYRRKHAEATPLRSILPPVLAFKSLFSSRETSETGEQKRGRMPDHEELQWALLDPSHSHDGWPSTSEQLDGELPAPHPSENKIHVRIQMYDNESSLTALVTALETLDDLCGALDEKYTEASDNWKDSS